MIPEDELTRAYAKNVLDLSKNFVYSRRAQALRVTALLARCQAAEEERDFWDAERNKAGLECVDLGERLGRAEEACKRLRLERDALKAITPMSTCARCLVDIHCSNCERRNREENK